MHCARINLDELTTFAGGDTSGWLGATSFLNEVSFFIDGVVGLSNEVFLFLVSSNVFDLVSDLTLLNEAVRSFDESKLVNTSVGAERVNQTNVRTLGGFNRANTSVVRRVNVSNFEACSVAVKTTRS